MHHPPVFPDPFAIEWGHDKFGTFQSFAVDNVVQRMRWIPPGTFMMGSPENEVGRIDDEMLHRVDLSGGFWLADTPVAQALWEAVMGTNPSQFKAPNNPVETVKWKDCQEFIARLNERIDGLEARLPTEEEWEYACRAGTKSTTWVGDFQQDIEKPLPQLDSIAWYGGNAQGTPQKVAQKAANPWGLYDMLGNVYEWCGDWYEPYRLTISEDSRNAAEGAARAIRGGCCAAVAVEIRAAKRDACHPDFSYDIIGLRLARSATRVP